MAWRPRLGRLSRGKAVVVVMSFVAAVVVGGVAVSWYVQPRFTDPLEHFLDQEAMGRPLPEEWVSSVTYSTRCPSVERSVKFVAVADGTTDAERAANAMRIIKTTLARLEGDGWVRHPEDESRGATFVYRPNNRWFGPQRIGRATIRRASREDPHQIALSMEGGFCHGDPDERVLPPP